MPNFGYDEVWDALEQSVKLQSHYAELLNMHDGGQRIQFADAREWLVRLRATANTQEKQARKDRKLHGPKS